VALVTGGARGFGRAISLLLAAEGADVAVADIARDLDDEHFYALSDREQLERTAQELRDLGRRSLGIAADVTSAEDCARAARTATAELGPIDILVANAGIWSVARAWEFTEEEWDVNVDVNLKGAWLSARAVVPQMIERRHGKIVFVSSIAGLRAYPNYAPYIAAKHGVVGLTKSLAIELGEYRINVNAVCPTGMGPASAAHLWGNVAGEGATEAELEQTVTQDHLIRHVGIPTYEDVAQSVLWLVSERARLITGHALPVDAGWIAKRGG
jgi:NAD(P)-dependent dehydrogenase (short-subunit alcohol dehydrogenase family)